MPDIPVQMKELITRYSEEHHCSYEKAEHELGIIVCGGTEYPVMSCTKKERLYFKFILVRLFLDHSKREYLDGFKTDEHEKMILVDDSDEKKEQRRLIAMKLLFREVFIYGGLSTDLELPDYLLKRAFNLENKFNVGVHNMYNIMRGAMMKRKLTYSNNSLNRVNLTKFLQEKPSISFPDQQQQLFTPSTSTTLVSLFPLRWFVLDELKQHNQFTRVCSMVKGLSNYKQWKKSGQLITDQLEVILPCKALEKEKQYKQLYEWISRGKSLGGMDVDSDDQVKKIIDATFEQPVSNDLNSLPTLIQSRLVSIIVQHKEFHLCVKRLIEDRIVNLFQQEQITHGRIATMIDIEAMSQIVKKTEQPARAYANLFATVLKRINDRDDLKLLDSVRLLDLKRTEMWLTTITGKEVKQNEDNSFPFKVDNFRELSSNQKATLLPLLVKELEFIESLKSLKQEMSMVQKKFKLSTSNCSQVKHEQVQKYIEKKNVSEQFKKPSIVRLFYGGFYIDVAKELGWLKRGGKWLVDTIPPPQEQQQQLQQQQQQQGRPLSSQTKSSTRTTTSNTTEKKSIHPTDNNKRDSPPSPELPRVPKKQKISHPLINDPNSHQKNNNTSIHTIHGNSNSNSNNDNNSSLTNNTCKIHPEIITRIMGRKETMITQGIIIMNEQVALAVEVVVVAVVAEELILLFLLLRQDIPVDIISSSSRRDHDENFPTNKHHTH